jgi:hypothetical protein
MRSSNSALRLKGCLQHAMQAERRAELQLHASLTSALNEVGLKHHPRLLYPPERDPVYIVQEAG